MKPSDSNRLIEGSLLSEILQESHSVGIGRVQWISLSCEGVVESSASGTELLAEVSDGVEAVGVGSDVTKEIIICNASRAIPLRR